MMAEFCQLHHLGAHVDGEKRDDACLVIRQDSWSHLPTGIHTDAALCGT